MMRRIPHELEELILHHLRRDSVTLQACALVCYRFAVVSQKLLFSNIFLDLSNRPNSKSLDSTRERNAEGLHGFLEIAPHIARSIHGIDVVADSYRLQTLDTTLLPCLPLLVNLCNISLDTNSPRPIYWRYLSPTVHNSLYHIVHSNQLVTLRLRRIFEVPLTLIAECTTLQVLSLYSVTFQQDDILRILDGRWKLSPCKQRPQLRTLQLSISDDAFRVLLNFLVVSNLLDISSLAELSISIFNPRFDYANINRLLQAVGSSLEVLCFSPMVTDFPGVPQSLPLHLHLLPHLRIFRLRLVSDITIKDLSLYSSLSYMILYQLSPDHGIKEISVKTVFSHAPEESMAAWTAINAILNKIVALQKITLIFIQNDATQSQMISRIKDVFPRLDSKAILRVQAAPSPLGFVENVNDTDLLGEAFRRHNMV